MNTRPSNASHVFKETQWFNDYEYVIGVDEVGRGCVAGPICAVAVVVKRDAFTNWAHSNILIRDSKKLSPRQRKKAFEWAQAQQIVSHFSLVSAQDIDAHGISWANRTVMQKVVDTCLATLPAHATVLVVSDHVRLNVNQPHEFFPHADTLSWCVALASILAKYQRDEYMTTLSRRYPVYGLEKHKGYGTSTHIQAIRMHGPIEEHRRSFLKRIIETESLS